MSRRARVLVVEDDEALREALCDTIEYGGYEPAAACNGVDDNCDGNVDENLDTDYGVFAGCQNYRYLIDSSLQWLNGNAAAATIWASAR